MTILVTFKISKLTKVVNVFPQRKLTNIINFLFLVLFKISRGYMLIKGGENNDINFFQSNGGFQKGCRKSEKRKTAKGKSERSKEIVT